MDSTPIEEAGLPDTMPDGYPRYTLFKPGSIHLPRWRSLVQAVDRLQRIRDVYLRARLQPDLWLPPRKQVRNVQRVHELRRLLLR